MNTHRRESTTWIVERERESHQHTTFSSTTPQLLGFFPVEMQYVMERRTMQD